MVTYFVKIFSAFYVIGNTLPWLQESATDQILSQINWFHEWQIIYPKLYIGVIIAHMPNFKNRNFYEYLSSLMLCRRVLSSVLGHLRIWWWDRSVFEHSPLKVLEPCSFQHYHQHFVPTGFSISGTNIPHWVTWLRQWLCRSVQKENQPTMTHGICCEFDQ
jgi:hypothetical protein